MALNLDILNLESFLFLKTVREEMALRRNVCLLSQEERIRAVKTDDKVLQNSKEKRSSKKEENYKQNINTLS